MRIGKVRESQVLRFKCIACSTNQFKSIWMYYILCALVATTTTAFKPNHKNFYYQTTTTPSWLRFKRLFSAQLDIVPHVLARCHFNSMGGSNDKIKLSLKSFYGAILITVWSDLGIKRSPSRFSFKCDVVKNGPKFINYWATLVSRFVA